MSTKTLEKPKPKAAAARISGRLEGWSHPYSARMWHYFRPAEESGAPPMSICPFGWLLTEGRPPLEAGPPSGKACADCTRSLVKLEAEKKAKAAFWDEKPAKKGEPAEPHADFIPPQEDPAEKLEAAWAKEQAEKAEEAARQEGAKQAAKTGRPRKKKEPERTGHRAPALAVGTLVEVLNIPGMVGTVKRPGVIDGQGFYLGNIMVQDAKGTAYSIAPENLLILADADAVVHDPAAVHDPTPSPDVEAAPAPSPEPEPAPEPKPKGKGKPHTTHTTQDVGTWKGAEPLEPIQDNPPEDVQISAALLETLHESPASEAARAQRKRGELKVIAVRMPEGRMEAVKHASDLHHMSDAAFINAAIETLLSTGMGSKAMGELLARYKRGTSDSSEVAEIKRITNRVTRTIMVVEDTWHADAVVSSQQGRWATRCETHKTHSSYGARQMALGAATAPWNWCAGCKGILSNLGMKT